MMKGLRSRKKEGGTVNSNPSDPDVENELADGAKQHLPEAGDGLGDPPHKSSPTNADVRIVVLSDDKGLLDEPVKSGGMARTTPSRKVLIEELFGTEDEDDCAQKRPSQPTETATSEEELELTDFDDLQSEGFNASPSKGARPKTLQYTKKQVKDSSQMGASCEDSDDDIFGLDGFGTTKFPSNPLPKVQDRAGHGKVASLMRGSSHVAPEDPFEMQDRAGHGKVASLIRGSSHVAPEDPFEMQNRAGHGKVASLIPGSSHVAPVKVSKISRMANESVRPANQGKTVGTVRGVDESIRPANQEKTVGTVRGVDRAQAGSVDAKDLDGPSNRAAVHTESQMGIRPILHEHSDGAVRNEENIQITVNKAVQEAIGGLRNELLRILPIPDGQGVPSTHPQANSIDNDEIDAPRHSRKRHRQSQRRAREHSSSSLDGSVSSPASSRSTSKPSRPRLPPFKGNESWEVWINRFEDVATRRRWHDNRRLDELLPLMQGSAGDFVYEQLTQDVRQSYHRLIQELTYRFRKMETKKTFGVKFSHREQQHQESVQAYSSELKMLYDKAYPNRDRRTRAEDLLRRFLDGISDKEASF